MMSLESIAQLNREAAVRAAIAETHPLAIEEEDLDCVEDLLHGLPYIGDHEPEGYEREEDYFVDASGWGRPGEPALTYDEFCQVVREKGPGFAYAITSAGQFQVYITRYTVV